MSYLTLSSLEKHLFYSFHTFPRIRQHYFSKYWGDGYMGRPPPQIFGGPSPQVSAPVSVPPRLGTNSPPMLRCPFARLDKVSPYVPLARTFIRQSYAFAAV